MKIRRKKMARAAARTTFGPIIDAAQDFWPFARRTSRAINRWHRNYRGMR